MKALNRDDPAHGELRDRKRVATLDVDVLAHQRQLAGVDASTVSVEDIASKTVHLLDLEKSAPDPSSQLGLGHSAARPQDGPGQWSSSRSDADGVGNP